VVSVLKGRTSNVPSYDMPVDGNLGYGYLRQAWMVVEKSSGQFLGLIVMSH
jgi:hypothetical protein